MDAQNDEEDLHNSTTAIGYANASKIVFEQLKSFLHHLGWEDGA